MLGHKRQLGKFRKIEIISRIFFYHNAMRLKINYKESEAAEPTDLEARLRNLSILGFWYPQGPWNQSPWIPSVNCIPRVGNNPTWLAGSWIMSWGVGPKLLQWEL